MLGKMSAGQFDLLRIKTHVLRVHCNCQGCKHKLKKILRKIEGVYAIDIDVEQEKVTVTGTVGADTLIEKLLERGKHAELWFSNGSNRCQIQVKDMNNSPFGYDTELINYKKFMEKYDRSHGGGYLDMEPLPGEIESRSLANEERDHGRNRSFDENENRTEHMLGYNGMLGIPGNSPPWNRMGNLSRRLGPPPQPAAGGLGFPEQLMSSMDMHNGYPSNHPSMMTRMMPELHNIRRNMIMGENLHMPYPQNMNQNPYFQENPYSYPTTMSAPYTYY